MLVFFQLESEDPGETAADGADDVVGCLFPVQVAPMLDPVDEHAR